MRKFYTFAMMLVVALTSLTVFTSCDEDPFFHERGSWGYDDWGGGGRQGDRTVTAVIDGCWRGNTHWYNSWTGHNYTTSEVEFVPQTSTYGTGYWVDYYDDWDSGYYIFNDIEWQVLDGEIQVHFIQENSYVYIYEYELSDKYFDGYINDNGHDVKFELDRISYPYYKDWSYYTVTTYSKGANKRNTTSGSTDTSNIIYNRGNWN